MQHNSPNTAAEYIRSFQNGEEKGFNFFFREFHAALAYYSFQVIKDKPIAEGIAGEALMKLWERRENFDNIPSIKSFLYTTTRNISLNWLRQQHRNTAREKEYTYLNKQSECTIFHQIAEAELHREIHMVIKTLPPKCRQVFQMLFIQGKNYKEIAKELHLPIDTIRSHKARAITLIKQRMAIGFLTVIVTLSLL